MAFSPVADTTFLHPACQSRELRLLPRLIMATCMAKPTSTSSAFEAVRKDLANLLPGAQPGLVRDAWTRMTLPDADLMQKARTTLELAPYLLTANWKPFVNCRV